MGIWYRNGTVSLNNNSATVAGVGTAFVANVQPGDGLYVGDDLYEIASIASNTQLTLERPYQGANLSNVGYAILPTRGVVKQAADAMFSLIAAVEGFRDGPLAGRFAKGTLAAPSLRSPTDGNTGVNLPDGDQIELITNAIRRVLLTTAALQVDVPITGSAVQSSPTDATTGKLLLNGAHGLGASNNMPVASDVNTTLVSGFYSITTATLNRPAPVNTTGVLVVYRAYGVVVQEISRHGGEQCVYRRSSSDSGVTWSDFKMVYASVVGSVSQSSGVPTGAVIERGSNANGEYIKLADGTMFCTHQLTASVANDTIWNYPAFFATGQVSPRVFAAARSGGPRFATVGLGTTGGSIPFNVFDSAGVRGPQNADLLAIGRWF